MAPRKAAAKKTAARKTTAKRAPRKTVAKTDSPARDTAYGFTVGDVVHLADVDPREDRRFVIVQTTGGSLVGESDGQRYNLTPDKIAKVD